MSAVYKNFLTPSSAMLLAVILIWYIPWLIDAYQIVGKHDNLDGEVVLNRIIGGIYNGEFNSNSLALNGNIPYWALSRFYQPLTALYALTDPWWSYFLIDFIVRCTAFMGLYLLSRYSGLNASTSTLAGLGFATSISYSVHLLCVAGMPLVIWGLLIVDRVEKWPKFAIFILIFFVGTNSSLALSGIFFAVAISPIVIYGFDSNLSRTKILCILAYLIGLGLSNANLLYAQFFSGIVWHRIEYGRVDEVSQPIINQILGITKDLLNPKLHPWYHVSTNLSLLSWTTAISCLFLWKSTSRQSRFFFVGLVIISTIYVVSITTLIELLAKFSNFFYSFQWNRFYFLYSLFVFLLWITLFKINHSKSFRTFLMVIMAVQLCINLLHARQIAAILVDATSQVHIPRIFMGVIEKEQKRRFSFNDYYYRSEFKKIKNAIGESSVLSVGLDPMIAPMNGVPSIDGYYNLYPLVYKKAFRQVIENSISPAGKETYYDKWGNRIYAFYPPSQPNLIKFCKALDLGADFVISSEEIQSLELEYKLTVGSQRKLIVYRINEEACR